MHCLPILQLAHFVYYRKWLATNRDDTINQHCAVDRELAYATSQKQTSGQRRPLLRL